MAAADLKASVFKNNTATMFVDTTEATIAFMQQISTMC